VVPAVQIAFGRARFLLTRVLVNCSLAPFALPSAMSMNASSVIRCDGCGQAASPEHIARRLRRLEWTTRYRPVHIAALFLGGFSPAEEDEFLYSPSGKFAGAAGQLLSALEIATEGKSAETVQAEFQRAGYFLTHALECPLESVHAGGQEKATLLEERLPNLASLIRRSFKPRRVILVTEDLAPVVHHLVALDLGCPIVLNDGKPFEFGSSKSGADSLHFRQKLAGAARG